MSKVSFTPEQTQAILERDKDILVAAAAGSGKTAVLVERIISIITDVDINVDVDKLLIVTFTEAAGREMKLRLNKKLQSLIADNPQNRNLLRQQMLLSKAYIGTAHSFFKKLISENFHTLDIDPNFRIGDSIEIEMMKDECLEILLDNKYEQCKKEEDIVFYELIEMYGDKITDESFKAIILDVYNFSCNTINPKRWIEDIAKLYDVSKEDSIDNVKGLNIIIDSIESKIQYALLYIQQALDIVQHSNYITVYVDTLRDDYSMLENIINNKPEENIFEYYYEQLCNCEFGRMKAVRVAKDIAEDEKLIIENEKEQVSTYRGYAKKVIEDITEGYFIKPPHYMLDDMRQMYKYVQKLSEIVIEFMELYNETKRSQNIMDFNDLEQLTIKLLVNEDMTCTDTAKVYQQFFYEVMIDEYQDTNIVQELIFKSLSKESVGHNNRFIVGDVKQSIYGFRRANPDLFIEKYNTFSDKNDNDKTIKIDLSKNFRSNNAVIDTVNFIFNQIMHTKTSKIDYANGQQLHYGADYVYKDKMFTEVLISDVVNDEEDSEIIGDKMELESKIIVNKIKELVNNEVITVPYDITKRKLSRNKVNKKVKNIKNYELKSKRMLRRPKYKDIVILIRSRTQINPLIDELKLNNIPVYAKKTTGFFENIEIQIIVSILQVIDNPIQDIHYVTVLKSPMYWLDEDELVILKNVSRADNMHDCVNIFLENYENKQEHENMYNILEKLVDDLTYFRKEQHNMTISEFVWDIFNHTNYLAYIYAMENSEMKVANLNMFIERAVNYEQTSYVSIFNFIKYLDRIKKVEVDIGDAQYLSETENVIRIMTIHESKGLEFPIVFVSQLGRNINRQDEKKNIVITEDIPFASKYLNTSTRIISNTLTRVIGVQTIKDEAIAEELRVVYVALTRAKEKLILTGVVPNINSSMKNWGIYRQSNDKVIEKEFVSKSRTILDIIMPTIVRNNCADEYYEEPSNNCYSNDNLPIQINYVGNEVNLYTDEEAEDLDDINIVIDNDIYTNINNMFEFEYRYSVNTMTKTSIAEIKRSTDTQLFEVMDNDIIYKKPNFIEKTEKIDNLSKGTIIHKIFEHIPYNKKYDVLSFNEFLLNLVETDVITTEELEVIDINKFIKYCNTDMFDRMVKANKIYKEKMFVLGVKNSEVNENVSEDDDNIVMINGIVDCFFEENDGNVLIDYKTDYVTDETIDTKVKAYTPQIQIYKRAIEQATNKVVKESYIYFFNINKFVLVQ